MSDTDSVRSIDRAREQLYAAIDDPELSLGQTQERVLDIGRSYLGADNGHIERIPGETDTHEVVASVGSDFGRLSQGASLDSATTYCRRTTEMNSSLAISDAPAQGWADDPAYEKHGFSCYLGTSLVVDGETYGTVCFVSRDAQPSSFTATERMFVELLGQLLSRELESRRFANDLTSQKRAQAQSEIKYEALLTVAPEAVLVTNTETGEIFEVNDRATELLGYDRGELLGMDQRRLQPPAQRDQYRDELDRILRSDGTLERFADGTVLSVQRADGTTVPVELSARAVELDGTSYTQAIVRDISDRRDRQEELNIKNRAINEASVGITIADARAEEVPLIYANQAFTEITGYDTESAIGRNCRFLQGPETATATVDNLQDAIEAQVPISTELINYRADGTPFWNRITLTPVENEAGRVTHFVGIQQDVTTRKRQEQLTTVLNRVLRHNLRNDMNVVTGYADLLADRHTGETKKLLDEVGRVAQNLVSVGEKAQAIEQTAGESATGETVAVGHLLDDVATTLRGEYPNATIRVQMPDDRTAMVTEQVKDVLRELGTNAATHTGGEPSIEFEFDPDQFDDGCVGVAVRDDGPGLPDHERRTLDGRHETPLDHGSGIGLWLVHWIMTGIGGMATTEFDDGGTTVMLQIPVATDSSAMETTGGSRQSAICLQPK